MQEVDKMEERKKDKIVKKAFSYLFFFFPRIASSPSSWLAVAAKKINQNRRRSTLDQKVGTKFSSIRSRLAKRTVSPNFPSKENSFEAGLTKLLWSYLTTITTTSLTTVIL